jgi:CheY-like chemotaxis protein/HPt (histidine-containing phosphotransfer) domain-containing protein
MNGVIGMTDLLLDSPLSDEQHRYAELLKTSGETLLSLINDLLDFSKIEAKKLELERKDFNFHESIRTTVSMMDINAREKSLALNISISDDVPIYVRGDAKRFRQILFNLIGNAVKFTDKGSITVQTFLDGEDVTFVTLRVEVIDTGIGIPPDKQKNLFTPFSQLDNSSTRKYGGTGLGLAISRQLAEMMGGSIGVSSDGIHGTTFTLIVRLAKSSVTGPIFDENAHGSCAEPGGNRSLQQGAAIQQVAVPIKKDEHLSILLAEDNPTNQIIARKILEKMGHSVDIVPNGEEAFNSVILKKYDLVLMDCQMPLMDGYESTRRMRARGLTLPIIAMTAHALSGDREKCIESGMSDYITKPVQMDTLAMAIARRNNPENSIASTIATTVEPELFIRDSFMSRVLNDTSLARTVIESFLGDIPTQIESLQSSAAVGDFSTAEHYAHRINGAAANLSCDRLRMYACEGERAAIDKDMDLLTSCIKRVIETFTDTKALLEAF